jgi:S1-C subfamily serine protease
MSIGAIPARLVNSLKVKEASMSSRLLNLLCIAVLSSSLLLAAERTGAPPREMGDVLGIRGAAVAHINQVEPGSVAESLGLSPGDLIVAFNGHSLKEFSDLGSFLGELRLAASTDKAVLDILKHDARTDSYTAQQVVAVLRGKSDDPVQGRLGVMCGFSYIVLDVAATGPGHRMGVKPGEFIEEINGQRVGQLQSTADLDRLIQEISMSSPREIALVLMHWQYPENGKMVGVGSRRVNDHL